LGRKRKGQKLIAGRKEKKSIGAWPCWLKKKKHPGEEQSLIKSADKESPLLLGQSN